MNIPAQKILEANSPGDRPRRSQVYVGFGCHQGCGFCYYKSRCDEKMFEPEIVRRQIDLLLSYGIRDFEITGGEPSECRDLRRYCEYIKSRSPESKIAIITNGGLFASDVWDLIDEVLLSYHIGRNTDGADMQYFPRGCTYAKAVQTVNRAKAAGKLLRINIVVGVFNVQALDAIVDDVIEFAPLIINFLPVNLFDGAKSQYTQIDYSVIGPAISGQLKKLDAALPDSLKIVRYIPFCAMPGEERRIAGTVQHIFDWFDWNVELTGLRVLELLDDDAAFRKLGNYGATSFKEADKYRDESYEKSPKCLKCKYLYVCDGVEKTPGHVLLKYVKPCTGIFLKNANEYIGKYTKEFYTKWYRTK